MAELARGDKARCIAALMRADGSREYVVSDMRRRRTLTQNAYYWAMLNRLAAKLGMADSEVHLGMLRDYGSCEAFEVDARVPLGDYFEYYDAGPARQVGGRPMRLVKVYKGSSKMDSAEFSRLVNGMRDECEAQGIDVMTPSEIAALQWTEG